jgi:hypothetical protein
MATADRSRRPTEQANGGTGTAELVGDPRPRRTLATCARGHAREVTPPGRRCGAG